MIEIKNNEKKAYKIYEKGGQDRVIQSAKDGVLKADYYNYCMPCEWISPIYNKACLVCGTVNKEITNE